MEDKINIPPGMQKFRDALPDKVYNSGTASAWLYCELCGRPITLVGEMNVFVYPDAPEYTTKALCKKCCSQEYMKYHTPMNN